MTIWPEFRVT